MAFCTSAKLAFTTLHLSSSFLFVVDLGGRIASTVTLPHLAQISMQVLTNDCKPFPSIACSGLMSCTIKSNAVTHIFSFSWAGILHLGCKNEPSLCSCKELDDDYWYAVLDLALHLLLCCCKWVVPLLAKSCFISELHDTHFTLTLTVFGMYEMKLIPYCTSNMFIFWKNNFVTFKKCLYHRRIHCAN